MASKEYHYVLVDSSGWLMQHTPTCDSTCEYNDVVLDGQTFSSFKPGQYKLIGFDPDTNNHPYLAWERPTKE